MAGQYTFNIVGLNKYYGARQVLKDIYLSFYPGAKIGIVGENGAGKSTLLRIMAGVDQEFQGRAEPEKGIRVGFVPQEPTLMAGKTVREHLEHAVEGTMKLLREYNELSEKMAELEGDAMEKACDRMGVLQEKIEQAGGWEIDTVLDVAASALVLPPDDAVVDTLSGGEKRRVALCMALLEKPDLLLLDEPTNHLDAETIDWLENHLKEYPGSVIVSTHDRYFLDNITKWILELDEGLGLPFEGNYSSWLAQKIERLAREEKKESSRRRSLERELKWIRMSARDHGDISRARLHEYEKLVAREKAENETDPTVIRIAPGPELGQQVIRFDGVAKGYGRGPLFENLSFDVPKGAVVGIVGPNGTGKTTLFKLIAGTEKPDAGSVTVGPSVKFAWVEQFRDSLDGEKNVHDEISEGKSDIPFGARTIPSRAYCGRFGFKGTDQQKLVKHLSGGERNRLHLAKVLKSGGNVIMLDEPTNDLDVNTLRMLEDAINDFSGCVLVISHDRFFLNRVCTHLLVFEGDAKVTFFTGNWEAFEAARARAGGPSPFENRRAKYRKFKL